MTKILNAFRLISCLTFISLLNACGGGGPSASAPASSVSAPASLAYSNPDVVYTVGSAISSNVPRAGGGAITAYTVSPALPSGLDMDAASGVITGTPAQEQVRTVYTVTGSNTVGRVTAQVAITVQPLGAGTWLPVHSMAAARTAPLNILLPNGNVLVAGGIDGDGTSLSSAELFNPATGAWSATGSMNVARGNTNMVLLPNGKVLVAGGDSGSSTTGVVPEASAELYDPATGT